jgi:hypothetical protein
MFQEFHNGFFNTLIGVDFDNTLLSYDDLIYEIAVHQELVPEETPKSKRDIREYVRQLPEGEIHWQRLQAVMYGPKMRRAKPIDGALLFLEFCNNRAIKIYIISHKTRYAKYDQTRTNLRDAAMAWMTDHRFFDVNGLGLSPDDIYFEAMRLGKLERIKSLGCTHFIDDLEETFLEPSFPSSVERILYAPQQPHSPLPGTRIATTWKEVCHYLFPTAG